MKRFCSESFAEWLRRVYSPHLGRWVVLPLLMLPLSAATGAHPRSIAPVLPTAISQTPASPSLPREAIEALAIRTTVVVAQDLHAGQVETGTAFNPGSGVIVARQGSTYYVATNLHVVPLDNVAYGVRTYDGKIHVSRQQDNHFGIYRLGRLQETGVSGFDLAIVTFDSGDRYPIAGVDLSQSIAPGQATFVSGWPQSPPHQPMQRRFSPGEISGVEPPSSDGGYGLFYTSSTAVGMSGGPVFDRNGQIIGIHGRGAAAQNANQGIQVDNLVQRANQILSQLHFATQPPNASEIAAWVRERPASADTFSDPEGSFQKAFTASALRDCSGSRVDTGDPLDDCRTIQP